MSITPLPLPVDPVDQPEAVPPDGIECLEQLRARLDAAHVALIRFQDRGETFEVLGSAGAPLLAPGTTLPTPSWTIALSTREGRQGPAPAIAFDQGERPLDRLGSLLGLRAWHGVAIRVGSTSLGAVAVAWPRDGRRAADVHASVDSGEVELVQALLARPAARRGVLVCHEHPLVAEGIARAAERHLRVTARVATTISGALGALRAARPDLIVCSDRLCPETPLPEVAHNLRVAGAAAPLLVLAAADTARSLDAAHEAGAGGYVPLAAAGSRLAAAAAELLDGCSSLPSQPAEAPGPRLTAREHEVLLGFDRGLSDKEIALELGVTVSTVKSHARAIYAKLEAGSRTQALHRARTLGQL